MSVLIIAEAGVNHNGSLELAKKMADVAKEAGADIVKYQTAVPELVISRFAPKAEYQKEATGGGESQLEMVKKIHFGFAAHKELKEYCDKIGIMYLSTPFDMDSIEFLKSLDMPVWKIPSGETTNLPYLERVAQLKKPLLMSTGMCEIFEVKEALEVLYKNGADDVTILHCNTEYPTPLKDANVRAMLDLQRNFGTKIGYSDHTLGLAAPLAAVSLGATIIEKHFTLDKNMEGPDHAASMNPQELCQLVKAIRETELVLGSGIKTVSQSEAKNKDVARKSIVAKVAIKKGETLTACNLTVKRPGTGISPMRWYDVIGTTAKRDFGEDELIDL
ncbi:MAG: N-acetylneuraminate synthase [Oscillospiraceae bacterium]